MERYGLIIDGRETAASGEEWAEVRCPATGEVLALAARAAEEDVDRAVRAARNAF